MSVVHVVCSSLSGSAINGRTIGKRNSNNAAVYKISRRVPMTVLGAGLTPFGERDLAPP